MLLLSQTLCCESSPGSSPCTEEESDMPVGVLSCKTPRHNVHGHPPSGQYGDDDDDDDDDDDTVGGQLYGWSIL